MDEPTARSERNDFFQKLKPCCIKISQLAIREIGVPNAPRELQDLTSQVLDIINHQIQKNPLAFDEKLAEYVFFPLYHIFRQMDHYPARLIENCIKCLQLLINHGWKSKISAKLVQQIYSLLVFIIDGVPGSENKDRDAPEELQLEAFRALSALLRVAGQSTNATSGLTEQDAMPALGHGITVMLDGSVDGLSPQIQAEALDVLRELYASLRDQAALANFLPGTISSMTKLLSSPSRQKINVLTRSLAVVQTVLTKVLGDMRTRSILPKAGEKDQEPVDSKKGEVLTPAWLKATSAQVKLALSTMMKLRIHDSQSVRDALERLCIALLDECHSSLSNCTTLLVETAIILDNGEVTTPTIIAIQTNVRYLANIYPELCDMIKTAVYNWMSSLPRIMQSGDEDAKESAVHNLTKGIGLMQDLAIESSTLEDSMGTALRDSIVSLMQSAQQTRPTAHLQLLDGSQNSKETSAEQVFEPVMMASESQRTLKDEVRSLVSRIGSSSLKSGLAANMMYHVRESESTDQIAAMWLCFELVKAANTADADSNTFLDLSAFSDPSDDVESISEDLYSYAVQVLESHADSDPADWRLEAIALEVTTYSARRRGTSFRPHLVDVLFPVVTFLGSDNPLLRQHAIVSLNSISLSCDYSSVSDLIVANVDYMVSSVSLRLNSLDISPASMQVLTMMIRLSGPRLTPYLNDVVESIFAALENYHGYTFLAENLFSVLKEIVDQASRADEGLLIDRERIINDHKKKSEPIKGLDELLEEIDRREERRVRDEAEEKSFAEAKSHPKEPWKTETSPEDDKQPPPEPEKPPNSPTYQLLLRIASLTQHYLTSPTPRLRRSLLELLATASSLLGRDEDSFLPLVNAIWPVVIERLRDPEPFISIEACHALVGICEAAGDFLSTRFKTEWRDWLQKWCSKIKQQGENGNRFKPQSRQSAVPNMGDGIMIPIRSGNGLEVKGLAVEPNHSSAGGLGQHASPVKMWDAVIKLLTAIVSYVRVDAVMFDDIVDLLVDVLEVNGEAREALETINADAVWLARYDKGRVHCLPTPVMEGEAFVDM
ncbi:hypothetical protein QQS21_012317 [Conoideocrella luteorostrata]|uniref:HEAT repeat protein n=1 Tax=Conoideocrella luteorostrata TaxID=1105319 RepID=A0AAJ0CBR7_9HYPO|nr:hypothetical protein QQS21_012317 [Conoideocrella luteorostrata]